MAAEEVFGIAGLGSLGFGWVGGSRNLVEGQGEDDFEGTGSEAAVEEANSAGGVVEAH